MIYGKALCQYFLIYYTYGFLNYSGSTRNVLHATEKGRKRKLSYYKSRNAKRKQKKIAVEHMNTSNDDNESTSSDIPWVENNPNLKATVIHKALDSDLSVNVKYTDSSMSSKYWESPQFSETNSDSNTTNHTEQDGPDNEDRRKSFKLRCIDELKSKNLLNNLVDKLYNARHLKDFMLLIRHLAYGGLPMDNIVFLLMLERAKFQGCRTTTAMRYSKVTKLFWSIVYRLCKSSALKFFSGEKNWEQVVAKKYKRSHYIPDNSKINFAVPSEHILQTIEGKLPRILPPGKIFQCMDLLRNEKDIVLMADGKLVIKGLKENFCGDVDLFGHETHPNISELEDEINRNLEFLSKCIVNYKSCDGMDKYELVQDLSHLISALIAKIRKYVSIERRKLDAYSKSVFFEQKYQKVISSCKTNIYTSVIWLKKAL